jgi:hypothetical protein
MTGLLRDSPGASDFRLRLAVFAEAARTLAEALERAPTGVSLGRQTEAVRRAFGRVPGPPPGDAAAAARYGVARLIATHDCDFVLWAAGRPGDRAAGPGGADPLYAGYARWIREQLGLLGA